MKKSGIISAAAAAVLCLNFLGEVMNPVMTAEAEEAIVYERYDKAGTETLLSEFEELLGQDGKDDEVADYYSRIIREGDYITAMMSLAQVQYSENMTQENLEECSYMTTTELYCESLIGQSLARALKSRYAKLMLSLLNEGYLEKIEQGGYELTRETEEFVEKKNELWSRYIDTAYSSLSDDEKNLKCAEIYLETAKLYNSLVVSDEYNYYDYAYMMYGRDYTPDDISAMSDTVAAALAGAYAQIMVRAGNMYMPSEPFRTFENNMDIISQFSYRVSDELRESAEEIREKNLYRTGSGSGSEQKSYTTLLNYYGTAVIYQYISGMPGDLTGAAHEFGHFNSMRLNSLPAVYIHQHNLDLAEVQSQGLEVLYTDFYDSIYAEQSEYLKLNQFTNMLAAVAAGFIGNEFENYVFDNADTLTPEEVVDRYRMLSGKFILYQVPFYGIPHFFQYPGYYVSYAVSALAALNLWDVMYRDFDEAADMYTELSHISIYNGPGYAEALESAGFDDVLSEEFINTRVADLVSAVVSGRVYGDTDGNGIVTTADFITLAEILLNPEAVSGENLIVYDITNDGKLNAADIIKLRMIMAK